MPRQNSSMVRHFTKCWYAIQSVVFLFALTTYSDLVKYEHAAERVLRTILAIGSKSQEKNMDTRKRAYTTIQELCESGKFFFQRFGNRSTKL